MADELRVGLSELLRKAMIDRDVGFLKEGVRLLSQALMEKEVEEHVGAERHERSPVRVGQRNGNRVGIWAARVGTVELKIPRVGMSKAQAGRTFSVSLPSVKRYGQKAQRRQSLLPNKRPGSAAKLDEGAMRLSEVDLGESAPS